ncbi:tRNA (cytosine(32)/uridine(32)-2'-O)-methyltransferase TrmJ [Entomomonas asaccharolytica]|uniref:tRNA (cytidine/uridine-2'-O-)-methyltransferase TrmJ n=1 Tax=Entomomonas asaccharolytica TaxID=2785331 RepID=A0A974RYC8_9GAMM|nr:tRNA (cytosine(32)/uridine(32)-2'-O)-methyltransferase TrmJ [Entomomonas asaccharolytica]QQP87171.1 tRNA (cytosine(32)/uridine(32)-2'-O)-methyltransferase TrmJ [Entomomonas asaccharolytica]
MNLSAIRVVLVATTHAGNMGATARAMKNMGLKQLFLVNPKHALPHPDATARASGADDILQTAQTVANLEEALTGCSLVLGTSARDRQIPWPILDPKEAANLSIETTQQQQQVALVFGREHAGLTNEELQRCDYHVHIPADDSFSSLNVAAAVQVLTYELRMAWLQAQKQPTKMQKQETTLQQNNLPCTHEELELFYQHLEKTLIAVNFLDPNRPRHLMTRLRRLYNRAQITKLEMNILRGILTETLKSTQNNQ